ncbi:DeoR/GlpR family DNA-binding transcription regulator [Anaerovorax odorimutans]|uniref:DeoR/GlpR family DNA-binding transcription regulator n=1 Tax=Anaerovorax odorimutans TaxID=109327 RepID=A0ABT1RSX2_9FIRM|nr:DeoR/GlpR family DNA-binding transcription regulator [Anaerovorax odorimutans]MCQ4638260.1 DeoR/GlpR family DNA-binding transcription regulator [Anaerovorax odorimutans]
MLQDERHEKILKQLKTQHAVKVTSLAKELGISESTIRRDINELHQMGKLKRVFGGAVSISGDMASGETDVAVRSQINIQEKEQIARYAATMINDNDFIFIDAGTTTERMIEYLEKKNVTYVTNGIVHAKKLIQRGFNAYMIGGLLRPSTEAAIGTAAIDSIRKYNFTKCFMGTNGVDIERGFTTPDIGEAAIKTEAMKQSYISFVLADHAKFGLISSVTFAGLDDACIITDRTPEQQYCQHTVIKEVEGV